MNRRSWKRRAALRVARLRRMEIPPPPAAAPTPLPPLECPDEDREFVAVLVIDAKLVADAA